MGNPLVTQHNIQGKNRGAPPWGGKSLSAIISISGTIADDEIVTIKGVGFGIKSNAKPLLYWRADDGTAPSPLGRILTWDGFEGVVDTGTVLPNSIQSFKADWNALAGAGALGNILAITSTGRFYVYRKLQDAFNAEDAVAIRARYTGIAGSFTIGQLVTGSPSGATGFVQSTFDTGGDAGGIFFEPTGGTINDPTPVDFQDGDTLTQVSPSATATGSAMLRSFNYKSLRLRSEVAGEGGFKSNMFHSVQGFDGPEWSILPEFTDGTFDALNMDIDTVEFTFYDDEVFFQESAQDVSNGLYNYKVNNFQGYSDTQTFITRTADHPVSYTRIVQGQVSNGAQPGTNTFYDTVYIDDTWHSVFLAAESTFSAVTEKAVCIPSAWSDGSITCRLRQAGFASVSGLYTYVKAANGLVINENGFLLP